jgi:hypothetical protein
MESDMEMGNQIEEIFLSISLIMRISKDGRMVTFVMQSCKINGKSTECQSQRNFDGLFFYFSDRN